MRPWVSRFKRCYVSKSKEDINSGHMMAVLLVLLKLQQNKRNVCYMESLLKV